MIQRMTAKERDLFDPSWRRRRYQSKAERLERLAAEIREREHHKQGGNSADRAARMRAVWARRRAVSAVVVAPVEGRSTCPMET